MKIKLVIHVLAFLLLSRTTFSQDIIVFRSGDEKEANIKKVGVEIIEYFRFDNKNGPLYEVLKNDVFMIKYYNGSVDYFDLSLESDNNNPKLNTGIFIDSRDNYQYKFIKIGSQVWMAENLQFAESKSICPLFNKSSCNECGRYYKYADALSACPEGWRLPSDDDWKELEIEMGMLPKEADNYGWRGTNPGQSSKLRRKGSSGFNLILCGKPVQSNFSKKKPKYINEDLNNNGYYWTSSEENFGHFANNTALIRHFKGRASIERKEALKNNHFSVRCIKN
jgi:uncharacterized protein (TIGR02145 family)